MQIPIKTGFTSTEIEHFQVRRGRVKMCAKCALRGGGLIFGGRRRRAQAGKKRGCLTFGSAGGVRRQAKRKIRGWVLFSVFFGGAQAGKPGGSPEEKR